MDAKQWLERVTGTSKVLPVALAVGMEQSTLNRQLKGGLPPETVVLIARSYGADPVASLVESGLITAEEAKWADLSEVDHLAWLADDENGATDDILLTEIQRRFNARREAEGF